MLRLRCTCTVPSAQAWQGSAAPAPDSDVSTLGDYLQRPEARLTHTSTRFTCSGICSSDYHLCVVAPTCSLPCAHDHAVDSMRDDWGFPSDPNVCVVGHEGKLLCLKLRATGSRTSSRTGAGVVAALGEDVDPAEWKIGDRAGVKPFYSTCGKCRTCRRGESLPPPAASTDCG